MTAQSQQPAVWQHSTSCGWRRCCQVEVRSPCCCVVQAYCTTAASCRGAPAWPSHCSLGCCFVVAGSARCLLAPITAIARSCWHPLSRLRLHLAPQCASSTVAAATESHLCAGSSSGSDGDGHMTFSARADAVLNGFSSRLQQVPMAMPQMCVAAWLKTKTPLRQVGGGDNVGCCAAAAAAAAQRAAEGTPGGCCSA